MRVEPIIAAEHLRKCYGRTEVIRDLNIEIHRGEFFSLLGPNGAGKSTTIGMLTGLIQPSGGRIVIGGVDLASNPMKAIPLAALAGFVVAMPLSYLVAAKITRERATKRVA